MKNLNLLLIFIILLSFGSCRSDSEAPTEVKVDNTIKTGKLSGKVMELYAKAEKIAPNNPRVIFGKAEFEIGGARYFKQDTSAMCAQIDKAITLFSTFKPETVYHPNWGLDRALDAQKECAKK